MISHPTVVLLKLINKLVTICFYISQVKKEKNTSTQKFSQLKKIIINRCTYQKKIIIINLRCTIIRSLIMQSLQQRCYEKEKLTSGFCNFVVCNQHMRKKRKHPKSGKFVRVCDDCQDKHMFQKYMKSQIKAQQALQMQQMIIASKHQQLTQALNGKRTRMQLLMNKRGQIQEQRKNSDARMMQSQNQVRIKQRKLQSKLIQLDKLQKQIIQLQKNAPRSLQDDFKALTDQNQKITKELVKYEKLCQQALKSKSKKQKQMYDEYYRWQQKQMIKQTQKTGKKQDCLIY